MDGTEVQPEAIRNDTHHDVDATDADDLTERAVADLSTDEDAQRDDLTVLPTNS